jgi:hypothetical protein
MSNRGLHTREKRARGAMLFLPVVLAIISAGWAQTLQPGHPNSNLKRLRLTEARSGIMGTNEICVLVYLDSRYHAERTYRKLDEPTDKEVYEGSLGPEGFQRLNQILDAPELKSLKSPAEPRRIMVQDMHLVQVDIARPEGIQELHYLTDAGRKHDNAVLKPLLEWWKTLRSHYPAPSPEGKMTRCAD